MLEQEQQHIPDAAVRTGGDDELPLTARNQACRAFKINGIVSVDAGIEILHHIGKIAFHDITLIQLGNAQLEPLRGNGDMIGNAILSILGENPSSVTVMLYSPLQPLS